MKEASEMSKTPEHKMYENAMYTYPEFKAGLETAESLEDLIDELEVNTYVDGGSDNDRIFFFVGESDGESIEATPYLTGEYTQLLREFMHDAPTESEEIDLKISHADLNKAVKRVLNITN